MVGRSRKTPEASEKEIMITSATITPENLTGNDLTGNDLSSDDLTANDSALTSSNPIRDSLADGEEETTSPPSAPTTFTTAPEVNGSADLAGPAPRPKSSDVGPRRAGRGGRPVRPWP